MMAISMLYSSCSSNMYTQEALVPFLALDLSSSEHSHVGFLSTNEEQKKLACDAFNTLITYFSLAHHVADTDCWIQNGPLSGSVFATFNLLKYEF